MVPTSENAGAFQRRVPDQRLEPKGLPWKQLFREVSIGAPLEYTRRTGPRLSWGVGSTLCLWHNLAQWFISHHISFADAKDQD